MKKFTFLAFVSICLFLHFSVSAQKLNSPSSSDKNDSPPAELLERCGTMEALENRLKNDPSYRAQYEKNLRDFQASVNTNTLRTSALTGPVIIPVVVHIVLPNPNIITDADLQYFIDRLNKDFSGFNADSLNGAPFFPVRGHSLMRFALARRDPSGTLTNGVERKVGPGIIGGGEPQAIKSAASGGLNPWPFQQYYNLWVGVGSSGILGIAPEIGVGTASTDGVSVDYRAFSNNPCFTIPQFSMGRTAVHEIGHNFGLYHTFQGGCANADFNQLTTPSQQLPAELLQPSDDTPGQSTSTSGCPTGTAPTGCTDFPDPPGKMYQNYMDYTDDACYSMFSNGQVNRMHYVLENFRAGYLTTQGHIPPTGAVTLDAMVLESVNPGGYELDSCNIINYSSTQGCAGPFTPKFRIINNGVTVITSITVGYILNGGAVVTSTFTGLNLLTGATLVVSLPTANLVDGTNQFLFFTSAPNGAADQNPANDTLTVNINVGATPLPVFEGFEGAFPPAPWTVVSVNAIGTRNWIKRPPGRNSANSLFIENFNNAAGAIDDFRSGTLATNPTDLITIEFDLAYRHFNTITAQDTLVVLISNDCGITFQEVYKKWGVNLSTGAMMTTSFISPTAADWRTEGITVSSAFVSSGKFQVVFRSKSRFGNNIFIDNINIQKKFDRDLRLLTILTPGG
ncbi:MAG: M43 family zinc metalloprotease, partial [Chitinophagaceae bacterium]